MHIKKIDGEDVFAPVSAQAPPKPWEGLWVCNECKSEWVLSPEDVAPSWYGNAYHLNCFHCHSSIRRGDVAPCSCSVEFRFDPFADFESSPFETSQSMKFILLLRGRSQKRSEKVAAKTQNHV